MGCSLRELAVKSGLSKSFLSGIESETFLNPSGESIEKLARGLRVPFDELFRVARKLPFASPLEAVPKGLEGVEADILARIGHLPIGEKDQDGLRVIVRAYLDRYKD